MSVLYLATEMAPLAAKLAEQVEQQSRRDPFVPVTIVVPNRYMAKWLRLMLARRHGIAINLHFTFLETALWEMLRAVDPRDPFDLAAAVNPGMKRGRGDLELLDSNSYRLLVLGVLLGEADPELAPMRRYFDGAGPDSRLGARRAWKLADRLATLIRDYEYHRQQALIQPWIRGRLALPESDEFRGRMEASQSAVFRHVIREPDGQRARLSRARGRLCKTLPQYAMEVAEILHPRVGERVARPRPDVMPIHLFGLSQISALHIETLRWLGEHFDLRMYHFNPLVARLPEVLSPKSIDDAASRFREGRPGPGARELFTAWGRAGAESFWLMVRLLQGRGGFEPHHLLPPPARLKSPRKDGKGRATVLERLQQQLLNQAGEATGCEQDESLQIIGCPGTRREVETAYSSILHNLREDPRLKQTDIAILVTDMNRYRPALQAVFDRPPQRLRYNLADYSAAGISTYGQALLAMLDLALESFTRGRVVDVLLNPCVLARLGVDRDEALTWVKWLDELGVYQGWDEADRRERGYVASPLFGFRLAMQRLRLGRFMEAPSETGSQPAPRFGHVIPYADMESQDRERIDAFSRAIDGLLPSLAALRRLRGRGAAWSQAMRRLMVNHLEVPADRPEEAQVRDRVLESLDQLTWWDQVVSTDEGDTSSTDRTSLTLPLVREFIASHLETIEGGSGEYLTGGVTIAALQPLRPIPFPVIYVLGLGEDLFPGSNHLSSFDLRTAQRMPGDILPAESNRFLFLETLLAAQRKLYLLWNNHDLQRDQALLPAVPVLQLERYLGEHVLGRPFLEKKAPLNLHDPETLVESPEFSVNAGAERLLALTQADRQGRLSLDLLQRDELEDLRRERMPDFSIQVPAEDPATRRPRVTVKDLRYFLENPALASLKRHLRLEEDEEDPTTEDDEPFVGTFKLVDRLTRRVLNELTNEWAAGRLEHGLAAWPARFDMAYHEEELRCRAPEGAFGAVDRDGLRGEIEERIRGSFATFLRDRDPAEFCGPILLGEHLTPMGAKRRFPALKVPRARRPSTPCADAAATEIHGSMPLAWLRDEDVEVLLLTNKATVKPDALGSHHFEPALFYLALLAGTVPGPDGVSSREWLRDKSFHIFISCRDDIRPFTFSAGDIDPEEAFHYLTELTNDYLDPTCFDLMPFDLIASQFSLSPALAQDGDWRGDLPDKFADLLEEAVDDCRENGWRNYWDKPMLRLAEVQVPQDAFAKVRRRFSLLSRLIK